MLKSHNVNMAMFTIFLLDFGQEVVCRRFSVRSDRAQFWVVFLTQAASFKLHLKNLVRGSGELSKLGIGKMYGVCLMEQIDDTFAAIIKAIVRLDTEQTSAASLGDGNNELESERQCHQPPQMNSSNVSKFKLTSLRAGEESKDMLLPQASNFRNGSAAFAEFVPELDSSNVLGFEDLAALQLNAVTLVAVSDVSSGQQGSGSRSDFSGSKLDLISEIRGLLGHCGGDYDYPSTAASGNNVAADQSHRGRAQCRNARATNEVFV